MRFASLSATALSLLMAMNSASASITPLSWDEAYTKAEALVKDMSLEAKVNITTGVGWEVGLCVGNTYPTDNFPALCLEDGPLGMRWADNVTAGVVSINAAASFDRKALRERGQYLGQEFHDKGVHVLLGPGMNFMRAPEGGRGWESGGEDPFLTGVLAYETITGIQSEGVIATAKHYILNDQELNRTTSSSNVDKRTLHEVYVWPYARSVEAGVGSVMCSYNFINDTYACEDDYVLNQVLKKELGFRGFVQSDWAATHSTAKSVNAGLDMTMPGDVTFNSGDSYFGPNLTKAVHDGEVSEERVTDMATRIVAAWYKVKQDEDFPPISLTAFNRTWGSAPYNPVQRDHKVQAFDMAAKSLVLLKNEKNTLPLSTKTKKIALIGSGAQKNPAGINSCVDHGCNIGHLAQGWGSGTADFPYLIDPIEGFQNYYKNSKISVATDDYDLDAAANTAKDADIAFVFSSADSGEGYIDVGGNIGDRNNLTLWNNGENLIKAVADANKNTVVVINSVGPVIMDWTEHPNIKAILWPGLAGQESGNALAAIVSGQRNPSGRLPYTIAKKAGDYAATLDANYAIEYKEKLLIGHRWFDQHNIEPHYAFGYGLSYSKFDYSKLKVKAKGKGDSVKVTATLDVKNSGKVDGAEVVQAYLQFPDHAGEPPKVLRGFEKVEIKAGKSEKVTIEFSKTELSIWDEGTEDWTIPSGKFTVHIGASSRDIRAKASFSL